MSETRDNECVAVSSRKKNASQFMNFASSLLIHSQGKRKRKREEEGKERRERGENEEKIFQKVE